ncbi:hypothetical protein BDV24DRAFT_141689 [Aspergillus arachidicola]|uniref:Uncharacterized protein n=1 Tax=Aspergillus arachidicola TaxID=656916 RepID=A0A5N6XV53_9EURO|nr:hypothetical protein BDV24DRAFT_141689 [Aspergillus arachidicola]
MLTGNPHSLPLSSMPFGTRRTETQNTDDNETGLAVASTITYSPRPNNIGIRIANSSYGNVEGSLEEDDNDEPPKPVIHAPPGFNDSVGIPCRYD